MNKRRERRGYLFIAPYFFSFFLFSLYPIINTFLTSLKSWDGFSEQVWVGIANYQRLLSDKVFWNSVITTVLLALTTTGLQMIFGIVLAFILSHKRLKGASFFKTAYFFPNLITATSLGVLFSLLFDWQSGSINRILMALNILSEPYQWKADPLCSRLIVILIVFWQYFGYYIIIFTAGINGISTDLFEAARVDGATTKNIFFKVVMPLLKPIILFATVTSIIGGLQLFDIPYTFGGVEGNPGKALFTMSMMMFRTTFKNSNFGYGATISQGIFVIIVVFSVIFMKVITGRGEDKR